MDEAGRCRRTDGKKWRCSKEVVPNEKYCEKHMHRGCSRKLVEYPSIANPNPSSSTSKPPNSMNNSSKRPPPAFTSTEEKVVAGEKIDKKNSSNGSKVEEERLKTDTTKSSNNNKGGAAVGLEFSPKRRADELEPRRCRRTDGKRWRCAKEVVGKDHKYCAKHMHRGAKKRRLPEHGECNPYALVKRANKLVLGFDSS